MSLPPSSLPLTSVVLVSFYTGKCLFAAIDSVLRQKAPIELIVVDNGNPDAVIDQLRTLAKQDTRVKLVTGQGNIGFGSGVNAGVKAATGNYLLVLNPDCILREGNLEILHRHAASLSSPAMIGARILNEDGTDQRGCRRDLLTPSTAFVEALHLGRFFPRYRLNLHTDPVPVDFTSVPAISGAFFFMSRKDYDLIKGFDEGYFLHVEDLDFCLRFRRAGGEIYFAPDVAVTHVGGTSEVTSDFIERHKAKSFSRYFHCNFKEKYPLILLWCLDIAIWMRYFLRRGLKMMKSWR